MNDEKMINDPKQNNEWDEINIETTDTKEEHSDTESQIMPMSITAASSSPDIFSDVKEYQENPFKYFETNQVNVQLATGDFQYETTDFVLPGRDGFDLAISRRYDTANANLEDMDPAMYQLTINTKKRDNEHNVKTFGLGYGWSFALPSIETVPFFNFSSRGYDDIEINRGYDYYLHLEDGRNLKINRFKDKFFEYNLEDVTMLAKSGKIEHPCVPGLSKNYDIMVSYKNGNKDYFKNSRNVYDYSSETAKLDFKLVARHDKFGNTICFDFKDYGGIEIIDTWGRTISLVKEKKILTWNLPGGAAGETCHVSYLVDADKPEKLVEVTDMGGHTTKYDYHNKGPFSGSMKYCSRFYDGINMFTCKSEDRNYLFLRTITYPNGAMTQFEYGNRFDIYNEAGGYISHYPLAMRRDIVGTSEYNRSEYRYEGTDPVDRIPKAFVTEHQDIEEEYSFNWQGLMDKKRVKKQGILISMSEYEYKNKLMESAVDQFYDTQTGKQILQKETAWEHDTKANVVKLTENYPDDPQHDIEVITNYGSYSMVTNTTRTVGTDIIREEYELYSSLENRVIKYKRVFVNNILKEKTSFEYADAQNPYRVTNEKQYFLSGSGDLEQSNEYVETVYSYNSSKYHHQFVSKERKNLKDADGKVCGSLKETIDYDYWGRMISQKDPRDQITRYQYDQLGRVVKETQPSPTGQVIQTETYYNDERNFITQTDANHQKMRVQYTPLGQVQEILLAVENEPHAGDIVLKRFRYNKWGELLEVTEFDGNGTASGNIRKTESYTYDSFGRVLTRCIPQVGYEEEYHYDEVFLDPQDGKKYRREKITIKGDSTAATVETTIYKDLKGQVRKEFLAGERMATYEYDNAGNNIRKIDAYNKIERQEYDYAGRVVKAIRTDNGQERIICLEYDALGNQRFSYDEIGKQTEYQYDQAGRMIRTIAPFDTRSQEVKYYYDGNGNVTWEKKAHDNGWQEIQYVYDVRNRLTDTYQYLSTGDWIRTTYQYDVFDRVTRMRNGDTPAGVGQQVTTYTYDRFGNVLTTTDADGHTEYCQYDKAGRLQSKTDRNGNQTIYQHDALGRLIKESARGRNVDETVVSEREYTYSKNGKLIRELSRETVDGEQTVYLETKYKYNEKAHLIRQEDPGNVVKEYTYDLQGNRLSFHLTRSGQTPPTISTYYQYDDLYRLKRVRKGSADGVVLAEYEYDEKGNRKTLRYPQMNMKTIYQYNYGNRIVSLENKRQGAIIALWNYDYDIDGNMRTKTNKAGLNQETITYKYDKLGRLTEEDYSEWKRARYSYDVYSNRTKMAVEGKTKNELASVTTYEYGSCNRLVKEVKKQGKTTEIYKYCYDDNGNETFRIWERTAPAPDYPGSIKLSGSWKNKRPTVYEWRHYNGFNQLIRINQDEKEIMYQYRGDGLRHCNKVRKLTESKSKMNVLCWDSMNIVAEQMDGEGVKVYQRGIDMIAMEKDGVVYYYILNEHGDVAQLWKQSGTWKGTYEYDAFGVEKNQKEGDENPFRYCGEYFDVETKTVYLRSRDYRASVGRFTSEDPASDGLNWYTYANNNPVFYIDPLGLEAYYIFYNSTKDKDNGTLKDRAEKEYNALIKSGIDELDIYIKEIESEAMFSDEWGNMSNGDIPIQRVALYLHSSPRGIIIDGSQNQAVMVDEFNGQKMTGHLLISDLEQKNIYEMTLYGCNTAHQDYVYENVAYNFIDSQKQVSRVLGWDGSMRWDIWSGAPILAGKQDYFESWLLDQNNKRKPQGRMLYEKLWVIDGPSFQDYARPVIQISPY